MYRKGVNLVEIIMATTVFSIVVFAFITAISYGLESIVFAGDRFKATFLAEEGLEAVRNIKDSDFANLNAGTYGIDTAGTEWALNGSSDSVGEFSREVVLTQLSPEVYEVESRVTWDQSALRPGVVSLLSRLSNWTALVDTGVGDWSTPILSSTSNLLGSGDGWKIDVVGNFAYIVRLTGTFDFIIADVTDASAPTIYSSTSVFSGARDVEVSGNYAFIASTDNNREILVYDVSNPFLPLQVELLNLPGNSDAYSLDLVGTVLHVVRDGGSDQYVTVDVSDPLNISVMSIVDLDGQSRDVYVNGNYAFVGGTDNNDDLTIVDVTDPNNVSVLLTVDIPSGSDLDAVTGYDDYLFLGDSSGIMKIYDVSDVNNISLLGSYDALDDINDMVLGVNNTLLFMATDENNAEIQIIDVSDLSNPFLLGSYDTDEDMNGAAYSSDNDRFYAIGDDNSDEFVIVEPS